MAESTVVLLWHLHQPQYRLGAERVAFQPWVRLHGVRAYHDMIRVLEEFPRVRVTINLVPTLLDQIQAYEAGGSDAFREVALIPAADLDDTQRRFVVDHFFSAQEERLIRPLPRFAELFEKRRAARVRLGAENAFREFSTADVGDLQALFDLAWFGFKAAEDFPEIRALRRKQRGYTPEDVRRIASLQDGILKRILPLFRAAAAARRVEITTSPYAHPILPLLIDSDSAREALPGALLPPRFLAPEDARRQIAEAMNRTEAALGVRPRGMWPSEGSISAAAIEAMEACGVAYAASDGDLLRGADRDGEADLSRPWSLAGPGGDVTLLFRDHELSDRIGFTYARRPAAESAADLLAAVRERAGGEEGALLLLALDGENPWEHYPDGGAAFLRALYGGLSGGGPVMTRCMGEAIAACPRRGSVRRLRAGSWINADFGVWIAGEEKNRAWELLGEARQRIAPALADPSRPESERSAAWAALRSAEGSDWFWWLDGQFDSLYRDDFDRLFRAHLKMACEAAVVPPPEGLAFPIPAPERRGRAAVAATPAAPVDVVVDGFETSVFEWYGAARLAWSSLSPDVTMQRAQRPFETLLWGVTPHGEFCLRLDPGRQAGRGVLRGMTLQLAFLRDGGGASEVTVDLDAAGEVRSACPEGVRARARKVLEVAVPPDAAGLTPGRSMILLARVTVAGETITLKEIELWRGATDETESGGA